MTTCGQRLFRMHLKPTALAFLTYVDDHRIWAQAVRNGPLAAISGWPPHKHQHASGTAESCRMFELLTLRHSCDATPVMIFEADTDRVVCQVAVKPYVLLLSYLYIPPFGFNQMERIHLKIPLHFTLLYNLPCAPRSHSIRQSGSSIVRSHVVFL